MGKGGIVLFVYCLDLEVFWVYLFSRNVFVKYDGRGNDLDICIFNVKIGNVCNKLVCVVDIRICWSGLKIWF